MRGHRFVHGHNGRLFQTAEEEFWAKVDIRGLHECWPWTGTLWSAGYGKVGRANKGAHVVAYQLLRGPLPAGTEIDHRCYNPPCCNPIHLEAVTHLENMRRRRPFKVANQHTKKVG